MEQIPSSENPQNTLADLVIVRLREAVISGELRPGERLSEPELARQLEVSRSPIREALHQLTKERLLERQANRRCYVWTPTEEDVDEIFSLRVMLESLASDRTINSFTEDNFHTMEAMIGEQHRLIDGGRYLDLIHADRDFHEYICTRADHTRLLTWWQQIMGQWEVLIFRRIQHNPAEIVPAVLRDHTLLLDAYRQRDLDLVLQLHRSVNDRIVLETKAVLRQQRPMSLHGQ
jgi:GntR family transcriptional regulator of gluconate operon